MTVTLKSTNSYRQVTNKREILTGSLRLKSTQANNINAVTLLVNVLRTALGPKGMYKMLAKKTDFVRPVVTTNDGFSILERMEVAHPAVKLLVDASKWMNLTVGDGTLSVVILTGALLGGALELTNRGVHPATILDGYAKAEKKAEELLDELAIAVDPTDEKTVMAVALSCIGTKVEAPASRWLASLVSKAAIRVGEMTQLGLSLDPGSVNIVKKTGGSVMDSELIEGMAIYREPSSHTMPRSALQARIALVGEPLEIRKMVLAPEIRIDSPEGMKAFTDEEHRILMGKVERIIRSGANVIICQEGLDDYVQISLGRMGIMGIRRTQRTDMNNLALATGGRVVFDADMITPGDLGYAKTVKVRTLEKEDWLFIEGCKNPKAVTLLARGSSSNVVEAAGKAASTALLSIDRLFRRPMIFPGGGSLEAELAYRIREWSTHLARREQLAAVKYAEALESIPLTLAETCGMNVLDTMLELRNAHATGNAWFGVNVATRTLAGMEQSGIVDLYALKLQVLKSATEVAQTLLRADDVFRKPEWKPKKIPEGPAARRASPPARVPGFDLGEAKRFLPETW